MAAFNYEVTKMGKVSFLGACVLWVALAVPLAFVCMQAAGAMDELIIARAIGA